MEVREDVGVCEDVQVCEYVANGHMFTTYMSRTISMSGEND